MPPRKEPKESVVYPASKRKVPAYKPLKPSGVPRTQNEPVSTAKSAPAAVKKTSNAAKRIPTIEDDSDEDSDDVGSFKPASKLATSKPAPKRRKTSTRGLSPMSIASDTGEPPDPPGDPMPSQSDDTPSIPQPLLIRLLHESFADKNTKIGTNAIQVVQKYVEIFVREAIARTQADKAERAERGECTEQDTSWLELEDLEAVAPGLVLDF